MLYKPKKIRHEQNENTNKEMKNTKNNQTGILELKNTVRPENFTRGVQYHTIKQKKKTSKYRSFEIIQSQGKKA